MGKGGEGADEEGGEEGVEGDLGGDLLLGAHLLHHLGLLLRAERRQHRPLHLAAERAEVLHPVDEDAVDRHEAEAHEEDQEVDASHPSPR